MTRLGEAGRHPEGLFFPDTYLFGKGTRDIDLLRQARDRMRKELDDGLGRAASTDLPLQDEYQALILASIVERETGAGRRARRGSPASSSSGCAAACGCRPTRP